MCFQHWMCKVPQSRVIGCEKGYGNEVKVLTKKDLLNMLNKVNEINIT